MSVAVDGVLATTVFFVDGSLEPKPGVGDLSCGFAKSPDAARQTALQEYRSLLLEHGLRNRRLVSVKGVSDPDHVHYPFWVAYFKRRGSYDFKALDAVSGEAQGVRMRKVFLAAFRQMAPEADRA